MNNKQCPETISIEVAGGNEILVDILADQFGRYENGEVRALLEAQYPEDVWSPDEFLSAFDVTTFEPPYAFAQRKADGVYGSVMFVNSPRFYFSFNAVDLKEKDNEQRAP